ncbi:Peptidyl-prolyl cis-trans isomerase ppiD [Georgfuchsia toluolica]|uniref:Periplasmic chaperone PpiD n=1 Tax=Georgfuchsia toluolica TaxID=424218 RepID=A0A916N1H7_9PROT|nr:SurA N-terminal domain-containing protein [Georgfuchsia toluolica]CAG4882680.1 Peptidyl-prolyl cis-trans isomerase ppiD [Georgfuchsia toluolica]
MFDIVRNNRRLVQVFLVLIMLPFAFFGVESYFRNSGAGDDVAKVGGSKITPQEFRQALRDQQERLRAQARGQQIPPAMLDSPEIRRSVIETLINRRLLADFARKAHFTVSDEQLSQFIASVPALQVEGKFSQERYDAVVAAQNLSKEAFEARLRQDLILQQAAGGLSASSLTGKAAAGLWQNALLEEREVASIELKPEQYLAQVKLAVDATKNYYDTHRKDFELPEQVRAEFVILSQAALLGQVSVSDAEIKTAYEGHADRYKQGEQRRASHILILADKGAPEAKVAAAKAKAEALLAQVKKNPKEFAALAKQNSQDTGSAAKGGDLDWFSRGAMVKPFEDAAFALKEGEISGVVRSDYGFHIIQLTGIRAEKSKSLADVRGEIETELKQQAAAKKYAEAAETFTNMVYEQADSLKPVADKFKLEIQQSGWIAKGVSGNGLASNPKLLAALFSDDAIKNKRNTEAVEVASNTLVAARVIESKPATVMTFDEVKSTIEKKLTLEEARKLAAKDGEEKLAALKKGDEGKLSWGASHRIARMGAEGVSRAALDAIFKTPALSLPAFAGATGQDGGYVLYRITQVIPYSGADNPRAKALHDQYQQLVAGEEFAAWIGVLREKAGIEINEKVLLQAKE